MNYKDKIEYLKQCAYRRDLDPIHNEIKNPSDKNLFTGLIIGDDSNSMICFLYEDKENNILERYEYKI